MFRFLYIIGILTKYSLFYFLLKLKIFPKAKPKLLRKFFEDAGGSFVKFGQLLALKVDVIPQEYSLELLDLFDNIKPFSYNHVKTRFLQELGATPEKIFKDFQKTPFASASFGQVHGAKLNNDEIVVVKILRPGIEEDVAIDFLFISVLAFFGDLFFKIEALPWREFAKEFREWTNQELNYYIEAENAEKIYQKQQDNKYIVIPKTYPKLSTKRILVQEYIEGIPLSRALRGLKDGRLTPEKLLTYGIDIKKSLRTVTMEILRQFFVNGIFHADPHPGNIILLQNDRIGLIDFGIIGESFAYNQASFIKFTKAAMNMDFEQSTYHFSEFAGENLKTLIVSALPANISQERIEQFFHILAKHFSKQVTEIAIKNKTLVNDLKKDYVAVFLEILKASKKYNIKIPKQTIVFIRMLSIVGILAKQLDPTFLLGQEVRKFFKKYPEETFFKYSNITPPFKRINRDLALERLNSWLSRLAEIDPGLYQLVRDNIKEYNVIAK